MISLLSAVPGAQCPKTAVSFFFFFFCFPAVYGSWTVYMQLIFHEWNNNECHKEVIRYSIFKDFCNFLIKF